MQSGLCCPIATVNFVFAINNFIKSISHKITKCSHKKFILFYIKEYLLQKKSLGKLSTKSFFKNEFLFNEFPKCVFP